MKLTKTLAATSALLALAVSAQAGVISVSAVTDATEPLEVSNSFTIVFYAEDTDAVGGIIGADCVVSYDPAVLDVVSITNNVSWMQTDSAYPNGFQVFVFGSSGGTDDDAGTISNCGGVIYAPPLGPGFPIATNGNPDAIIGITFHVIGLGSGSTTVSLLPKAGTPDDTFARGDQGGNDGGANFPLDLEFSTVPEPTTILVLGSGLVALLGLRTRRSLM